MRVPPKIILDENLFYDAPDYHKAALSVVKRLRDKFGIEATYVGEDFAGCTKRAFKRSNPDFVKVFMGIAANCQDQYNDRPSSPTAISDFKHCINERLSDIDADPRDVDDAKVLGCVPQRGSADTSIRTWAELNDALIVSCDGGRELESSKTDRILITCPVAVEELAADIVGRLRSVCYR